jgi:hypothetical protein
MDHLAPVITTSLPAAAQGHCALYRQRRPPREEKSGQVLFRTVTAYWVYSYSQVARKLLAGTRADCIEEKGVAKLYRKAFQNFNESAFSFSF